MTLPLTVASMEPARQPTGYENKVIHADIRVQSIDTEGSSSQSRQDGGVQISPSQQSISQEDRDALERASEMQLWWDEAIARNMNLPDGYHNVAVLLIKWADQLDELRTRDEAEELEAVFRDRFHYRTQIVELNVATKPQHQLNRHLSAFVEANDGPNNLMIVYYTGHGRYQEKGDFLQLTASTTPTVQKGFNNEACANWNKVEEILRDDEVDGDVLAILDTCFSSNFTKSARTGEDVRTYELLSACAFDGTTASPGELSFTRALIDGLIELQDEYKEGSFTTFHLNQRINLNPIRRDTPSHLWYRLQHHERHIRLAPLKPEKERLLRQNSFRQPPRGYLTLRFALRDDSLNREQIDFLTSKLSKAFSNKSLVGLRRIDWLGLKPARSTHFGRAALAMYAYAQWKKVVAKRRLERRLVLEEPEPEQGNAVAGRSPTRKRSREDSSVGRPETKRGLLVVTGNEDHPLSPPGTESP